MRLLLAAALLFSAFTLAVAGAPKPIPKPEPIVLEPPAFPDWPLIVEVPEEPLLPQQNVKPYVPLGSGVPYAPAGDQIPISSQPKKITDRVIGEHEVLGEVLPNE